MKTLSLSLSISILIPVLAFAQQGERIFKQTCATGYCHGARGEAGGAPRLAGRGFDKDYIDTTIARGIPGTAMQGFGQWVSLKNLDLDIKIPLVILKASCLTAQKHAPAIPTNWRTAFSSNPSAKRREQNRQR